MSNRFVCKFVAEMSQNLFETTENIKKTAIEYNDYDYEDWFTIRAQLYETNGVYGTRLPAC